MALSLFITAELAHTLSTQDTSISTLMLTDMSTDVSMGGVSIGGVSEGVSASEGVSMDGGVLMDSGSNGSDNHATYPPNSTTRLPPPSDPPKVARFGGMRAFPLSPPSSSSSSFSSSSSSSSYPHHLSTTTTATATATSTHTATTTTALVPLPVPLPPLGALPCTTSLSHRTHPTNVVHCTFLPNYGLRPGRCWCCCCCCC